MSQHNEVGKIGEEIAKRFLIKQGYKIIEQNYKTKYAEIDLIAKKPFGRLRAGKIDLVFVEVRTKVGDNFGTPEETINKKKMRKLTGNALAYTAFKKWNGALRIDAICIVLNSDYSVKRLNHYENIV
ncbi:MAG: YraN family protein [Candidatus Staskawiczbacteria bacterium]|nr:YraN family protein [Candidatus Staskawiczbacteria bacterium]MBI3337594.1 YraN family protein [Candidatus Staskawiczbacteria bacterium]